MYPKEIVQPMKDELLQHGFKDLTSPELIQEFITQSGSSVLVINSVCGCAAGSCRPAVIHAMQQALKKPNHLGTTFAGFDVEAVEYLREKLIPYPASSPAIAFFNNGKLVHFVERFQIEGRNAAQLSEHILAIIDKFF
ncbi:MAG: BrxA/BrxB family bacilliredoxin [Alphaproteobacteria bacterium]|nr:BrxA/BrxB family bacilliredoxin [Alphaproteobacteria bacterium]